jgi:hypothetical protein
VAPVSPECLGFSPTHPTAPGTTRTLRHPLLAANPANTTPMIDIPDGFGWFIGIFDN